VPKSIRRYSPSATALRGELRLAKAERDLAEERLRACKHELFGASSEARETDQLGLFNEAEALGTDVAPAREEEPATQVAGHTRGKRGRKPLDPNLPREIVRHELPESDRFCAHDGHALVEIGVESSEQLDVIPEQVRVVQHQRVKYACPCCDLGIKVTPAPARIISRGLLTESALAWIITGKYQYGMPLYRQATLLRRFGGDISANTLAASVVRVGLAAQPVINLMRDVLLDSELIYGDETTFQVLKELGRRHQSKSYLWTQVNGSGPPVRMFSYSPGRGAQHAQRLYAGVSPGALLMTDGYELYNGIAHAHQLVHLGCWAHYLEPDFISRDSDRGLCTRSKSEVRPPHKVRPRSQGLQEREEIRVGLPWLCVHWLYAGLLPERSHGIDLHLQVDRDVPPRRCDAGMAKVVTDHGYVRSGLKQGHGTAMSQDVGCDVFAHQCCEVGRNQWRPTR
jgi:transposase